MEKKGKNTADKEIGAIVNSRHEKQVRNPCTTIVKKVHTGPSITLLLPFSNRLLNNNKRPTEKEKNQEAAYY